jgi:hypothetical protein
MDDDRCQWVDCHDRWTVEVERADGYYAVVCDRHSDAVLDVMPEGSIASMTGIIGLESHPGGTGGHRARRLARRKAERRARRHNR